MTIPSQKDLDKVEVKLQGFLKKLNPDGSPKRPMDDNLAKQLMRDAVRNKWMYCPTKLAFVLMNRIPDMNPSTRTKWLQRCNICGKLFKETDIQVDHIKGETSFTECDTAQEYASSILDVGFDDLQILCIPDHKTKSRAEYLGIDWTTEEGWNKTLIEQEYTRVCELKATPQKQWLTDRGIEPASNGDNRKIQIREVLFK